MSPGHHVVVVVGERAGEQQRAETEADAAERRLAGRRLEARAQHAS